MQTLVLYTDVHGEPRQCLLTHETTTYPDFREILPDYNYHNGTNLFLINLYDNEERPDVVDEMLAEIPCEFLSF